MRPSFAQIPSFLHALPLALLLAACATLPPPTAELQAAQQAVSRADAMDADQHAGEILGSARSGLSQAQAAMAAGREGDARRLALLAEADAELALARSRAAVAKQELSQRRAEIAELERRLQEGDR
ncbi:MAG: DUF4398 domain-containing protein [Pseudoxanthomonas suwonensis]|nr:DUF4398 domain-containing protein [Pseudoxanthomonas suwonensis]